MTGNATINCLEYELPNLGNDATVKVIGLVYGIGNVTVKNINMYGNLNMDDNNTGLLIYTVGNRFNGTITIDHCDNYCNMVNSGYSSAYVGRVYGENVHTTLIVNGCTNYGTIISTGKATSMILANPTRYSNNTLDLQISNCVNKGKIYAPEGQSTYLAMTLGSYGENCFYESGSLAEFETEGKIINADGGEAGSLKTGKISVTDDDKFDLNSAVSSIENATRFELSFGFNGTGGLGGGGVTNYTFIFEDKEHLVNIPAYTWINAEVASYIEEHNDYGTTYYTCGDNYVYNIPGCKMSSQPTVMLTTYDSNGDVLLVSYYTYDGVQ